MSELRSTLREKQEEAAEMIAAISAITSTHSSVVKTSIMKSAHMILLYNAIESLTYLSLEKVHERSSVFSYSALSVKFRSIWSDYYLSSHANSAHSSHLEKTVNGSLRMPDLQEFSKRIKVFSGNLDARKLNQILEKYGIGKLHGPELTRLKLVKDKRNSLAHGELMFKECCRDISVRELDNLTNSIFAVLGMLVDNTEKFLDAKGYLSSPS
ncbi:MAE_28990/MAE_18760 family HEPN-like nuclease [Xanthomonas campestris]|uniref:MAE_28990/MAE_18760 family HEPN-like nuclease n=1 Tax=Xanthomonas campestris TaxID=339 RepID=UPI002377EF07|nr:MAE_28990/MAE_18760 family HEPN-like nuclease [Xanthomonas campestris]WDK32717.1 hypothetical protein JH307_05725 [Xanthomonas campestris]